MEQCNHKKIVYDDFISYETDEMGRCTKYVAYSHCTDCNHKFKKFFKLVKNELKARTYVMEKEEHD